MKKIINGKKYDTKTATWLAIFGDSNYSEDLFRKKTGEYFILKRKGVAVNMDLEEIEKYDVNWDIEPFKSEEDAAKWVEEKANSHYEEIFGEVEE